MDDELCEILSKLEHRRTRIIYDSSYAALCLILYHILPHFSSKRLLIAVYSDVLCRRLEEMYNSLVKDAHEIRGILENAYIIKVGAKEEAPFGQLYSFIPQSNAFEELLGLEGIFSKLKDDDLLILYGLYMFPAIYGKETLRRIIRLFNAIPKKVTVFGLCSEGLYEERVNRIVEKLYDVILRVSKEKEEFFSEGVYTVGIEQSIVRDIQPGYMRFKILDDGKFVRV